MGGGHYIEIPHLDLLNRVFSINFQGVFQGPCLFVQLDPDISNSDNSESPLIRSNIHSPWSALLLIFISLI